MILTDIINKPKEMGLCIGASYLALLTKISGNHALISYGQDFLLPLQSYLFAKTITSCDEDKKYDALIPLVSFMICSAGEFAQKVGLIPGSYDPKDFIAYGAGAAAAVGLEYLISKKEGK